MAPIMEPPRELQVEDGHGLRTGSATEGSRVKREKIVAPTVFESSPSATTADAQHTAPGGTAHAAQALITEASQREACVFENQPVTPHRVDASASLVPPSEAFAAARSVFESAPRPSQADVLHGCHGRLAKSAQALIQAAAEDSGCSVFESQPKPSRASVMHGVTFASGNSPCVFESTPAPSRADALHDIRANSAAAARELIEEAAEQVDLNEGLVRKSSIKLALEAEALINAAAHAKEAAFVFESQPAPSKAHVRHGQSESSEDESDEDTAIR